MIEEHPTCPYCGAGALQAKLVKGKWHYAWLCGTQRTDGGELNQRQHMSCRLNVAVAEIKRLRLELESVDCEHRAKVFSGRGKEIKQLREALSNVQWKNICGGQGQSSYPTCVGCGIVSHGSLSTPPHEHNCVIENALRPAAEAEKEKK